MLVLLVGAGAVLTGCDPYPPANGTGAVEMTIDVTDDGGARAQLILDRHKRTHAELVRWGQQLAPKLFPGATSITVEVNDNLGGYAFPVIHAAGVYRPGPHPRLALDTRPAAGWLFTQNVTSVAVQIDRPAVSTTGAWFVPASNQGGSRDLGWYGITNAQDAPYGHFTLRPQTGRSLASLGMLAGVLVLVVVAALTSHRRQRARAAVFAVSGIALVVLSLAGGAGTATDNLGVGGVLSGFTLRLAGFVWVLWLGSAVGGISILFIALGARTDRTIQQFNPAPGWPAAPPGWAPGPGWRPDPQWPPAPPGWNFYPQRAKRNWIQRKPLDDRRGRP
jgi:hypothetical protein